MNAKDYARLEQKLERNGAELVCLHHCTRSVNSHLAFVVAKVPRNHVAKYVTWTYDMKYNTLFGDYFTDLEDAIEAFQFKVKVYESFTL